MMVAMRTQCPCLCGRRLPLSPTQIRDCRERWRNEVDLAQAYNVPVAVIRHVRSIPAECLDRLSA
jgi:hypothetical protein